MHQTICQKCGESNRLEAVVCAKCGVKLAHSEQKIGARLKRSGLMQSIVSSPWRLTKWLFRKAKIVIVTLLFLLIIGGGGLYFFLFVPMSWGDYPMPQPVGEDKTIVNSLQILRQSGGIFAATPQQLRQLGNLLIFDPYYRTRLSRPQKETEARQPDRDRGYFSFSKLPHDQFGMVLYQKIFGKLPFRLAVVFTARREQKGLLELEYCRIGNLPVPASLLRMVAEQMLDSWNPDQQFLAAFDRIVKGEMELQVRGREDKITLQVHGTH